MKIERATLREIPLRLKEFFQISSGGSQDRRILLLTLEGEGLQGWGECVASADPSYACLLYTSPSPRDATLSRIPACG